MIPNLPDGATRPASGTVLVLALVTLLLPLNRPAGAQDIFAPPIRPYPNREVDIQRLHVDVEAVAAARHAVVTLEVTVRASVPGMLQFAWPTHGLQIDSVRVSSLPPDTSLSVLRGDSLVFSLSSELPRFRDTVVWIQYRLVPGRGLEASSDPASQPGCCLTTSQRWLPIPDDPGERFEATVRTKVPDTWTTAAAGERRSLGAGVDDFRLRRPARVQDLGFTTGAFTRRQRDHISYLVSPEAQGNLDALHASLTAPLSFYGQRTGYRLPWDSLNVVLLPSAPTESTFPGVQWLDSGRLADRRTLAAEPNTIELALVAAKQWTHGVLAPDWWSESWVNEALAGMMALAFIAETGGQDHVAVARSEMLDAYLAEAGAFRRPLVWDRFENPEDLLDAHALSKGPLVLAYISGRMGSPAFWTSMRRLLARRAFQGIDSDALLVALEPGADGPIARLFDAWVFSAGHPELRLASHFEPGQEELQLQVIQLQEGPLVPLAFPLETQIEWLPFGEPERQAADFRDREEQITISTILAPRYVVVDPEGLLVARTEPTGDLSSVAARLRQGATATRLRAASELGRFVNDPAATLSLRLAFTTESVPAIRKRLLQSAAVLPPTESLAELLATGLSDPEPAVRIAALDALARRFPDGSRDALFERQAQRDSIYAVQAHAVMAMTGPRAEGLARAALITPSEDEVLFRAGISVLSRIGAVSDDDFLELTSLDRPAAQIIAALDLAAELETARLLRVRMLELLQHPETAVREAAITAAPHILRDSNASAIARLSAEEWDARLRARLVELAALLAGES